MNPSTEAAVAGSRNISLYHFFRALLFTTALLAGPAVAQSVIINEVDADQAGVDSAEFVELYDGGTGDTSLDGLVLVFFNGNGDVSYGAFDLDGLSTDGNGYFVLCGNAGNVANCDLDVSPNTDLIQNGADAVALYSGDATGFPTGTAVTTDSLIDAIVYDTADSDDAGLLVLLNPGQPQVDENGGGDGTGHSNQRCPNGTGGARNTDTYAQFLPTPGVANSCTPPAPNLVINEIDYDQTGTDTAEFIEIANTGNAAADLTGHSLVLVNGSNGTTYATIDLSSVSLAAGDYFVVCGNAANVYNCDLDVSPDTNLIQNGPPDAVALYDGAALLDTVSYEGDTVAPYTEVSGVGLVDLDAAFLGISRFPDGVDTDVNNVDFSQRCITPGAENIASDTDCTDPAASPTNNLVINEIDYDQPSTDAAEFIEIANTGDAAANLAGLSLVLVNGSNDTVYATINLPSVSLAAGDYFVVCGDAANVYNCDLDVSPNTNLVQNGAPDAVALYAGTTLLDTVSYEGDVGAPYTEGSGTGLEDSASAAFLGISRYPDGADTDVNNVDFSQHCITPGEENTADNTDCTDPTPSPLRINEIDYDQPSTDTAEFVEIFNAGSSAAALGGVDLVLINGTGGGAAVYQTIPLPDVSVPSFGYFVVCANAATVANCDLEAISSIQNGAPDAVALQRGDEIIDTVSYEGDTGAPYTEGSGSGLEDPGTAGNDNLGISRVPNGADTDQNNVNFAAACITPGLANTALATGCAAGGPVLEIFEIQGSGSASPYVGQGVATQNNIVTAVGPQGFFMQTPTARTDADIDTSDGIYVYTGAAPGVAIGDSVDVTAEVVEFYDFTELGGTVDVVVNSSDNALPAPVTFNASVPSPDPASPSCAIEFECYEGMLVEIASGVVTSGNQYFGSDPVAEVYITAGARAYREPGAEYPGLGGSIPVWDTNPEVFELDPDKLGLPNRIIPAGSSFSATGVIGYEFGGYELWPSELSVTDAVMPRAVRARAAGETTVGSLNLYRLCDSGDDCAGRLAKFSMYVRDVLRSPDILAVQEAFDLGTLQDLADRIATDDPDVQYTPYLIQGNDVGGIDVGFLVRADRVDVTSVVQLGASEIFDYDPSLLHDRPPLLLTGAYTANGARFRLAVMVVHNRSLSGIDTERVQLKRLAQAESIAAMVQDFQTTHEGTPLAVVGDFNAYEFTDGYVDAVGHIKGDFNPSESLRSGDDLVDPNLVNQVDLLDAGQRYSFIFAGSAQTLDHALTNEAGTSWARGMQFGRGNADAANDLLYNPDTPLRSSDHDGLVLYFMSDRDGDGVADDVDACPNNQYASRLHPEYGCEVSIPTLDPAGLALLLLLVGGLGVYRVSQRNRL